MAKGLQIGVHHGASVGSPQGPYRTSQDITGPLPTIDERHVDIGSLSEDHEPREPASRAHIHYPERAERQRLNEQARLSGRRLQISGANQPNTLGFSE